SEHDDDRSADDDAERYFQMWQQTRLGAMKLKELADGQAGDPAEENRDPAEIRDRRGMHFSDVVRLIDDAVMARDGLHHGREHEGDQESGVEDIDVRRDDLVGGIDHRRNLAKHET